MIGATKKMASEWGQFGIRVNAIAPGITDTDMIKNMRQDILEEQKKKTILKRLGEKQEIAQVAAFLLSENSSYMTGQVIRVDGGII